MTDVVGKQQFEAEVVRSDVPVLVDFWAPWCPPCRALTPILQEVAGSLRGAKIVKVNIDETANENLTEEFGVSGIPALLFFKDGQEVRRRSGLQTKEALRADLEAVKRG